MKTRVFLLGGYDLEMLTIAELLKDAGETFFDKQLQWGAMLTAYTDELTNFGDSEKYEIFGIELDETNCSFIPKNYTSIDHHNDYSHNPSALEQVCAILEVEITEHQMLVAANDALYIDGMVALGANKKMIDEIRSKDRAAQGVTEQDEKKAEEAIKNKKEAGGLTIVYSTTSRFSPICDRLYPCNNMLIYTDEELTYYGKCKKKVRGLFEELKIEDPIFSFYEGGGDNGFIGIPSQLESKRDIQNTVDMIRNNCAIYSYHIFYYAFMWKKDDGTSSSCNLSNISAKENSNWIRGEYSGNEDMKKIEGEELFGEKNYFYPFVHSALYDDGTEDGENLLKHFNRKEPSANQKVSYTIKRQSKIYELDVDAINLNIYTTGVGVLSFYLINRKEEQSKPDDILNINQFGRRIFPAFWTEVGALKNNGERSEIADYIAISGLGVATDNYQENFEGYELKDTWKPAAFIKNLIYDFDPLLDTRPVIDDRMIVNCWYGNDDLSKEVANSKALPAKEETLEQFLYNNPFWCKYIFVDSAGSLTCQNDKMYHQKVDAHSYLRWQKYGTIYGMTRYSLMLLTNTERFGSNILSMHMRTMYSRMLELVIVQRTSVLIFSERVKDMSYALRREDNYATNLEQARLLYADYIRFVNQFHFREVTAQDQGIELYDLMSETLKIPQYVKDLDTEIEELHSLCDMRLALKMNSEILNLTNIATFFAVASIVIAILAIVIGRMYQTFEISLCSALLIGVLTLFTGLMLYFIIDRRKSKI